MTDHIEPPRDRKKEKNIKHSGNVSLDEIYNVCFSSITDTITPFLSSSPSLPSSHLVRSLPIRLHYHPT